METVSQQIKQLNQKNQELSVLENRIVQLKQQLNLQQANNNILKTKVDKIVHSKKQKFYDQMKLNQILQDNAVNNDQAQYMIQRNKVLLNEELRQTKQDMLEEKYLQTQQMKQKLDLDMLINQKKRDQQLLEKQQQYAKISEWEFNLKLDLKQRQIDKIDRIRSEEKEFKEQLAKRILEQHQLCEQLTNQEQRLLSKLKHSQQFGTSLKNDLTTAMHLSIKEYKNNMSVSMPTHVKSYSSSKLPKEQQRSPYAQLPTMLMMKINGQINKSQNENSFFRENIMKGYQFSLPSLCKPSFTEQQQQVERLYQSKTVKNSKSDLQQILNYCDSTGKIEQKQKHRMNQSEILKNQASTYSIKENKQNQQEQEQSKQQQSEEMKINKDEEISNQNQQEEQQ
ncbi:unnamed protein product (macronuclear) [Paramecium tetraurelia]|uniref:Lebercilin domain-containing protein n=1 Tax=Paramecium tetraurelia TaxID=5888 RepID=A0BXW9_PARTE|nr:uncharacterized protein GSPATT00033239001 [Paramecium tetraurelia]CAK63386.1 unnamed protein product [Paramecium tetraurelia]|eukprot:XP_001430784.1 hypothetical protein (macronuclear) [Paramecium tetraurelia strain d4-2]